MHVQKIDGSIVAAFNNPNPRATHELDDDDAELLAFLNDEYLGCSAEDKQKLIGVEILGVMCSATKDDQNGLNAIATGVTMARANSTTFPDTNFRFSNGNTLVITDSNFDAIYAAWVTFRQSFFAP